MKNRIRTIRERNGLTQKELAARTGTSQQQIARLEAGAQSVKLELAGRIASALGTTLNDVFPGIKPLVGGKKPKTIEEVYQDDKAFQVADEAGIDLDPGAHILAVRLRGGTNLQFEISASEARRFARCIGDGGVSVPFFVSNAGPVEAMINLSHLLGWQDIWQAGTADPEWTDPSIDTQSVSVYFIDSSIPEKYEVEPDTGGGDDEDADEGPFRSIQFMAQSIVEPGEFFQFQDADGDWTGLRGTEIAAIVIPTWVVRADVLEAELDEEDSGIEGKVKVSTEQAAVDPPNA